MRRLRVVVFSHLPLSLGPTRPSVSWCGGRSTETDWASSAGKIMPNAARPSPDAYGSRHRGAASPSGPAWPRTVETSPSTVRPIRPPARSSPPPTEASATTRPGACPTPERQSPARPVWLRASRTPPGNCAGKQGATRCRRSAFSLPSGLRRLDEPWVLSWRHSRCKGTRTSDINVNPRAEHQRYTRCVQLAGTSTYNEELSDLRESKLSFAP